MSVSKTLAIIALLLAVLSPFLPVPYGLTVAVILLAVIHLV